jgi:6-phosphogluconolactonase (cycloisomerase 2 family)
MPSRFVLAAISLICVLVLAACNCAPTLRYITVAPTAMTIDATTTQQFTATTYYSDGTQKDATSTAAWSSANTAVATVNASGQATGLTLGTAAITATFGGISASGTLTVGRLLQSITITPATATVAVAGTQAYDAMGTYAILGSSTPTTVDITSVATWTSSAPAIATIDSTQDATNGTATGVTTGTTMITASLDNVTSNQATLNVGVPTATGLKITPATSSVAVGNTVTLSALVLYSDGTTHPLTGPVTWSGTGCAPSANVVAPVPPSANNGTVIVSGASVGTAACTVAATEGTLTGSSTVSVILGTAAYGYIANSADTTDAISQFAVSAAAAAPLTPLSPAAVTSSLALHQVALSPNGLYAYAIETISGAIVLYDVAPQGGTTPAPGTLNQPATPFTISSGTGAGPNWVAIDPTGRFLYVLHYGGASIDGFTIGPTGTLTAIGAVTNYTTNMALPVQPLFDSEGDYLYIINGTSPGNISAYSINQTTGALTPLSTPTIAVGNGPTYGSIDSSHPATPHLYVTNAADKTVTLLGINPVTGLLTMIATSGPIASAVNLHAAVIDPSGKYLYVVDRGDGTNPGQVYGYNTGTGGGVFGTPLAGTPLPSSVNARTGTIDPTSKLLVVDGAGPTSLATVGTLSLYAIGTNGGLTADTPVPVGHAAFAFVFGVQNQ